MNDDPRTTLSHWITAAGIIAHTTYLSEERYAIGVYANEHTPNYKQLWNLRDFIVSSISGPIVWLVPRI